MSTFKNLSTVYDPTEVELRWSSFWVKEKIFTPEVSSGTTEGRPSYSIVMPPPNITGTLHLGHALNNTLQDIMARTKKMQGYNVLWVPGIDHAGIATQNVVERMLADEGTDRHSLGREKFIERVWKWKEESGGTIIEQLKRLGASCDWTRQRFTMDEGLSTAVRKVFVELYNEELIYRGNYIINWCPRCHTALSDIEVEAEERDGSLWHLSYPLTDGSGSITVATTRPETMLGDVAVAVNPTDSRYSAMIGKTLTLPLVNREIPVIADESVQEDFGTGAVKITPAHDFNDFDMSKRHGLEAINIMNIDAAMNDNAGAYKGLDRYEARKRIVSDMESLGLLKETEKYVVRLGHCYRCRTVVEPRLSKQWFVHVESLSKAAIKAVEDEQTVFVPKNWEKTYFEWMRNIRDWCISRQIWWGHRIPAWYCEDCDHITVSEKDPEECGKCSSTRLAQDPDVLDTWFSSALWPFSTLKWPEEAPELKTFYPTSALFTSFDIIFFWVARMMMMGIKFMGEVPFKEVYIHALVRDADGQKMSKSKGNVIDPLVIMDKFGTDALRFTLAAFAAQGRDIKLDEERIEGYRNFCNKLWNLSRFTFMNLEGAEDVSFELPNESELTLKDKWILSRLSETTEKVTNALDAYNYDVAAKALYSFIWHEFCDWYIELIKPDLRGEGGEELKKNTQKVLLFVLRDTLRLLHPFMPFITEEIHSYLPGAPRTILETGFPKPGPTYEKESRSMEMAMEVIHSIRNIRTEMNILPKAGVSAICLCKDDDVARSLVLGKEHIKNLAKVTDITIDIEVSSEKGTDEKPVDSAYAVTPGGLVEVFIPLKGLIDIEAETNRLAKELAKLQKERAVIEKKLSSEGFLKKAPEEVILKDRSRLEEIKENEEKLNDGLKRIKEMA